MWVEYWLRFAACSLMSFGSGGLERGIPVAKGPGMTVLRYDTWIQVNTAINKKLSFSKHTVAYRYGCQGPRFPTHMDFHSHRISNHTHTPVHNATQYFNAPFTHPCWEVMLTAHLFELTKLLFSCIVILVLAFFFLSSHFWILPHCWCLITWPLPVFR